MSNVNTLEKSKVYREGQVVSLNDNLLTLQLSTGESVLTENLGPGTIEEFGVGDEVLVHWHGADLICWVKAEDLSSPGPQAHLIEITRHEANGRGSTAEFKVVDTAGLLYDWKVDFLPENVLRTVRSDGWVWTFEWNDLMREVYPLRTTDFPPPTDDYAEALTVADLTTQHTSIPSPSSEIGI